MQTLTLAAPVTERHRDELSLGAETPDTICLTGIDQTRWRWGLVIWGVVIFGCGLMIGHSIRQGKNQ